MKEQIGITADVRKNKSSVSMRDIIKCGKFRPKRHVPIQNGTDVHTELLMRKHKKKQNGRGKGYDDDK